MSESINNNHSKVYWLVLITLLIKLILLPFAQTINADVVSRIFISINWLEDPKWINNNIWAPFHFYINGFGLSIWNDRVITPKIVSILFSSFTLLPFYFFTKREFNENGAFIATIFLAISPILFRNSFLAFSGIPCLFFLALSINLLSKSLKENSINYILLAGLSLTIASGIRFEAWIIIGLLSFIILLLKKWKLLILFNVIALSFPLYWLLSCWLETGNPLYSFQGTYSWAIDVMHRNDNMDLESYLRRIWFFPFSWVIAMGIPSSLIILKTIFNSYRKKSFNKQHILYSIPFGIMLAFFLYNSFNGILLLQHRYVGTLVILSLPFIALYFRELSAKKIKLAVIYGFITISLSFVYNTNGIIPLPRLEDQSYAKVSQIINKNTSKESCLILDFIGWDYSYYIALRSSLPQEKITIRDEINNSTESLEDIDSRLKKFKTGVILLKKNSELYRMIAPNNSIVNSYNLATQVLYQSEEIILFSWEK